MKIYAIEAKIVLILVEFQENDVRENLEISFRVCLKASTERYDIYISIAIVCSIEIYRSKTTKAYF